MEQTAERGARRRGGGGSGKVACRTQEGCRCGCMLLGCAQTDGKEGWFPEASAHLSRCAVETEQTLPQDAEEGGKYLWWLRGDPIAGEFKIQWMSHTGCHKRGVAGQSSFGLPSFHLVIHPQRRDRLHTVQLFVTNERRNFWVVPTMFA
jgi:hypothetical protein